MAPGGMVAGAAPARIDEGAAREALDCALACLRREQREGRYWAGTLSSSALATAIATLALHLDGNRGTVQHREHGDTERDQREVSPVGAMWPAAGANGDRGDADAVARGRAWLLATQLPDGGWGDAVVDAANINATALALGVLSYTAPATPESGAADALARAHARLEAFGGFAAVGDPARCTLSGPARTVAALAGLMDWRRIKRLRPEVVLLPARLRRTISTTFPAYLSIATLHARKAPHPFNLLPTYGLARRRVPAWLRQAQGVDGSFEESAFLTALIIVCMVARGAEPPPWLPAALHFVRTSQRADGSWPIDRDLETFDTSMTVHAFREANESVPRAARVRDWLLARQFDTPCFPTSARPGGWAWAMPAGWPECDDTAYAILALLALGVPTTAAPIKRGARWLERMQNADGSWSTFVRGSRMPFDHDCPYITGHVLSALRAAGRLGPGSPVLDRALAYLQRVQRGPEGAPGSFASIWFRAATAGTASVLEALADCGLESTPLALRARDALLRGQSHDGGWAGLPHVQASTAEETAWAVLALLRCPRDAAGEAAIRRGLAWLVAHQRPDGAWTPAPIGLYYSAMWYADSYFALTLPTQALARARRLHVGS